MDDFEKTSIIIDLGQASAVTCGGSLPPSLVAWPLRVYAGFQGGAPRCVRVRTIRAKDASLKDDELDELGADPLWLIGAKRFGRQD